MIQFKVQICVYEESCLRPAIFAVVLLFLPTVNTWEKSTFILRLNTQSCVVFKQCPSEKTPIQKL